MRKRPDRVQRSADAEDVRVGHPAEVWHLASFVLVFAQRKPCGEFSVPYAASGSVAMAKPPRNEARDASISCR